MTGAGALVVAALAAAAPAESGTVDWPRRVVRCTGLGAPSLRDAAGNILVARLAAERAARRAARRSCLAALNGIVLETGITVASALAADDALAASVRAAVKVAKVVGAPRYFSDGGVELTLEVPLGGKLEELLFPRERP
jgi:hypothetical protein